VTGRKILIVALIGILAGAAVVARPSAASPLRQVGSATGPAVTDDARFAVLPLAASTTNRIFVSLGPTRGGRPWRILSAEL
jgi:hypothetical protein